MSASIRLNAAPGPLELVAPGTVGLSNFNNSGVLGWQWELADKPPGSTASISTPNASTASFTVDVIGTYLVRLRTYADAARTIPDDVDSTAAYRRYAVPHAWRIPACGETDEVNTTRGWAAELNDILIDVRGSLAGSTRPIQWIVGNVATGWTSAECNYLDTGNGAALRQAGVDAEALAPLQVEILVAPGTYTLPLPSNQFYCPSNAKISAGVMPANERAARSVTIIGNPPVAATFASLDGRMGHVAANGCVRGIKFEQHGITVTSPTGAPSESLWQILTTHAPVTFEGCEFYFRQEEGTYMPIAPIGGYQPFATINDVFFRKCKFDVEIEGNTWIGLRDIEIIRYRKQEAYWTGAPSHLTSIIEDCYFRFEPNVLVTGDGETGKMLVYADGGFSLRRVYCEGSWLLDNRGWTMGAGKRFSGMFADDVTFDLRQTGWHAQISLIAGAQDGDCEWLDPSIRNIKIFKAADRPLTGWLEIVAYYGTGPGFVSTTIHNPLVERINISGDGLVERFQTVISSTAPGFMKHVVVRGYHAPYDNCQVYLNNHYTPPHSVPDRIQHIDGVTFDDCLIDSVLFGRNISSPPTFAEITAVSILGGSQINRFETETAMTILDEVNVSADSNVYEWVKSSPFPVAYAARRFEFGSAPLATDDSSKGYREGDFGDVSEGGLYRLVDATPSAAIWSRVDPGGLPYLGADNFAATFTPGANTTSVTLAPAGNVNCKYMRIGKMCRVELTARIDPVAAGVCYFTIGDLPFPPKSETLEKYIGSLATPYYATIPPGGVWMFGASSPTIQVNANAPSGSAFDVILWFTYEVAP